VVEYVGPPLTRRSLARLLAAEGISETAYHLYGERLNDAMVLDRRSTGWEVFYCERGEELAVCRHDTEAEACLDLLGRWWPEEHNRYQLVAGPAIPVEADRAFEAWLRDRGLTRTSLQGEYKMDQIPWSREGHWYRRYFVHRKRFRERFGRWP
jgi:hypothetical protein